MPVRQGNKQYMQILLDIGKFNLLESCARERGVKITALARDVIYEWLSRNVEQELFEEANRLDDANWKQTVRNRVNARMRNKASKEIVDPLPEPDDD